MKINLDQLILDLIVNDPYGSFAFHVETGSITSQLVGAGVSSRIRTFLDSKKVPCLQYGPKNNSAYFHSLISDLNSIKEPTLIILEQFEALSVSDIDLLLFRLVNSSNPKVQECSILPISFIKKTMDERVRFNLLRVKAIATRNSKSTCSCPSLELFHYGCSCGYIANRQSKSKIK
jgi:hypothetical protein